MIQLDREVSKNWMEKYHVSKDDIYIQIPQIRGLDPLHLKGIPRLKTFH